MTLLSRHFGLMRRPLRAVVASSAWVAASPAAAEIHGTWSGLDWRLSAGVSVGASVRLQDPASNLVGKSNLNPALCREDACQSRTGDPEPFQRLDDAPGAFSVSTDDGTLNYPRGEVISAPLIGSLALNVNRGEVEIRLSGRGFYDFAETSFDERHPNTDFQPARTPRSHAAEREVGHRIELRDAFVSLPLPETELLPRGMTLSVGQQGVRWGEASLLVRNSLAEWTPLDAIALAQPGAEFSEVFQPLPLIVLSGTHDESFNWELLYQWGWKPARVAPAGSFFSSNDLFGGRHLTIGFGNYPEDPDRLYREPGAARLISASSRTALLLPNREPQDGGQYGVRLGGLLDFNGGTEWDLYYARYHSRFQTLSFLAGEPSCGRGLPLGDRFVGLVIACGGFNSALNPLAEGGSLEGVANVIEQLAARDGLSGLLNLLRPLIGEGQILAEELLPLDTISPFFEYPEDIDLYGFSFNTALAGWSLAGEVAYRPNQPLQLPTPDLVIAALGPSIPEDNISIGPLTIPGERSSFRDFVSAYRGTDIGPRDYIAGYERFEVAQFLVGGQTVLGPGNWFAAPFAGLLLEAGATWVPNLPDPHRLPIDAGSVAGTQLGADSGQTDPEGSEPGSTLPDASRVRDAFATEWSYGLRGLLQLQYPNLLPFNVGLNPRFVALWDIGGRGPLPIANFFEGRKQFATQLQFVFSARFFADLGWTVYTGARSDNTLRDRDFLSLAFHYRY